MLKKIKNFLADWWPLLAIITGIAGIFIIQHVFGNSSFTISIILATVACIACMIIIFFSSNKSLNRVVLIIGTILLFGITGLLIGSCYSKHKASTTQQQTQVTAKTKADNSIKLDGNKIGVFKDVNDAESNAISIDSGTHSITGDNLKLSSKNLHFTKDGDKTHFEIGDGVKATIEIKVGGDGTFVSSRLSGDIKVYYFTVYTDVIKETPATEAEENDLDENTDISNDNFPSLNEGEGFDKDDDEIAMPAGIVQFGNFTFQTFSSEDEAFSYAKSKKEMFTIPTAVARELWLTVEPTEGTARIWCNVCMIDDNDADEWQSRLNSDSGWSAPLDVTAYSGHQVTICMRSETGMGFDNGTSFVSFFIPEFEVAEDTRQPVVE